MSTAPTAFDPPGPGTWLQDGVHVPRPWSRYQAEIHPPNLAAGFREGARRYGLLLDTLDYRMVHGLAYFAVAPPPEAEIPAIIAAGATAIQQRLWREDVERWEREAKPASIRDHLALQRIDPGGLDDAALAAHVERCREHQQAMIRQHHRFSVPAIMPIGDLLAHAAEWTGRPPGELIGLVRGTAPESAGSTPELTRLAGAIRASDGARSLLREDDETALAALLAAPGEVGAAARAYVDLVGYRLLDSIDTGDPYALEVPHVVVEGIRLAVEGGPPASSQASDAEVAAVRDDVPDGHRDAFDELLAEARRVSPLRDERGLYSEVWAGGLARRALLEAGRRLAQAGRVEEPVHLVDADWAELQPLLASSGGPPAGELAGRAADRASRTAADAPPFLGAPPEPPPPLDGLPPETQRVMRAVGVSIDALFAPSSRANDATTLRGIGASPGTYTGPARVIAGPHELHRLERGDVLVVPTTAASFNVALPLLGAIVTDSGGLLSHAAIVSRELGLPGVVGCREATRTIADGARVRVDGEAGEVTLLD
ncbi:MAG: PEP-utilizing enzyme [Thermoleophilia bacterium]